MKNIILFLLIIIMSSCTSNVIEDQYEVETYNLSPEVLHKIISMSFDTNAFLPKTINEGVIVEGDILITNEVINSFNNRQVYESLVKCSRIKNVRIKNDLGNNIVGKALPEAIKR